MCDIKTTPGYRFTKIRKSYEFVTPVVYRLNEFVERKPFLRTFVKRTTNAFVLEKFTSKPCRVGSVGSVIASRTVGREFASRPGHTKDHHKMVQTASLHRHACVRVRVRQCSSTV